MKKVLVLLIGVWCICAVSAQAQSSWSSNRAAFPTAQMSSTSSSLISMQAHERLSQSCYTSYSVNQTSVQETTYNPSSSVRRVGPNKPNEPGVPIGDGIVVLLLLIAGYAVFKKGSVSKTGTLP